MRDLEQMLKVTAIYASGPDDDEDVEIGGFPQGKTDDDFIYRDEVDDEFLWIAWFQQEEWIVKILAENLLISDKLTAEFLEDKLRVRWNSEEHDLPLSIDSHNSYIVISSMAHLLRDSHDFWLVKYLMEEELHAILITTKAETGELTAKFPRSVSRYFIPLERGHDYFSGIDIPYLDHEDHNPLFEQQRDAIAPILTRILEEVAQRGKQLREEHRQRQAWQDEMLRDVRSPEVNASEISRKSAEFGEQNARTLEEFARKITLLRQEITQIVEDSRG